MNTSKYIKLCTLTLILLALTKTNIAHANVCGGAIGPGVFNVFSNGKVAITNQQSYINETDTCKVNFSGSTNINVGTTDYFQPTRKFCGVTATNVTLPKLTLPTFPSDFRDVDISTINQGSSITVNGVDYQSHANNSRWCRSPTEDGNRCQNGESGMTQYTQIDGVTLPTTTNSNFIFSNAIQNVYDDLTFASSNIYFRYNGTQPFIIDTYSLGSQPVVTFEPGTYFFRSFNLNDFSLINVSDAAGDGSGKVKIYIQDGANTKMIGNQSCFNMAGVTTINQCSSKGTPNLSTLQAQRPEKLAFYIYTGDVVFGDTAFVSASIYLNNGTLRILGNDRTTFVGEALASNIRLGNMNSFMHYKDTDTFSSLYGGGGASSVKSGEFSLAPPAVPKIAGTGDLTFMTSQSELNPSGTPATKWAGYLRAYPFVTTGATATTPTWTMGNTDIDGAATNNPIERLAAAWDSYIGLPNGTQPVIYKNRVLMTSSDGSLYMVNRATGAYISKWTPPVIATHLSGMTQSSQNAAYEIFLKSDAMEGQLAVFAASGLIEDATQSNTTNPKTGYIFGTAKGGAIHYALSVAADGAMTSHWNDNRKADNTSATAFADLTGTSPNSAAPVVYNDTHVIYLVNNRRVVREITRTDVEYTDASELDLDATAAVSRPTSTPLVANNRGVLTLYLGGQKGEIFTGTVTGTLAELNVVTGTNNNSTNSFGAIEPILFISYAQMNTNEYLTAQSDKRVSVFRKRASETQWSRIWTSFVGGSQVTDSGVTTQPTIQSLPAGGRISAKSLVLGGKVFVPVEGAQNASTCSNEAFQYIFNLDPTATQLFGAYYFNTETTSFITLGTGRAFSPQAMIFRGKLHVQGSSEKNSTASGGRTGGGLDNPIEMRSLSSPTGRRGWREVIED